MTEAGQSNFVNTPFDMSGRRVLVTGAARGIGAETAKVFAGLGAHVVVTDILPLDDTVSDVKSIGGAVDPLQGNLLEVGFVERLMTSGPFFSVAHVAGVFDGDSHDSEIAIFRAMTDINIWSTIALGTAALEQMKQQGEGYIVFVGSLAGRSGGIAETDAVSYAGYAATKGGVHSVTRWLARRAIHHGVRVNCIAPGAVETPMVAGITHDASHLPMKRRASTAEIAWPIVFLGTPGASYMSGVVLDVNSGAWTGS